MQDDKVGITCNEGFFRVQDFDTACVFTIFDSFLDPGTSTRVSKTVFRLRGIPWHPGNIVHRPLLRKLFELYAHMYALLFTTRSSTTTRPEDTKKIGPNNLTCPLFFTLFLSKLAPTCSSLPLPTSSLASSSSILPHFRPLCSPNLGCQDFREGARGNGLKLEKRED